jgi:catechol 2,3-dioxygenase-like lactoylglutathione lyase family enzyme
MIKQPYVMIMVSDMNRSIRFYTEVLGLKLGYESPEWTEFESGGATIALHRGRVKHLAREDSDVTGTCSLGFIIDDLDQTFRELTAKGVTFTMPPTERKDEGIKLAICLDPDGLPISLSQHQVSAVAGP